MTASDKERLVAHVARMPLFADLTKVRRLRSVPLQTGPYIELNPNPT